MTEPVTSTSLAGPSAICMLMPIKAGFTDALATQTYEGRLGSFTKLFSDLRAVSRESRLSRPFSDIVDRLETILGVTISIIDGKLLLAVQENWLVAAERSVVAQSNVGQATDYSTMHQISSIAVLLLSSQSDYQSRISLFIIDRPE